MPLQNYNFQYKGGLESLLEGAKEGFATSSAIRDILHNRSRRKATEGQADLAYDLGIQDQILKMGRENVAAGGETFDPSSSGGAGHPPMGSTAGGDASFSRTAKGRTGPITQAEAPEPGIRGALQNARASVGQRLAGAGWNPRANVPFRKTGQSEKEIITGMEQSGATARQSMGDDAAMGRTVVVDQGQTDRERMGNDASLRIAAMGDATTRRGQDITGGSQNRQNRVAESSAANQLTAQLASGIKEVDDLIADPKIRASFRDQKDYQVFVDEQYANRRKLVAQHIKALIGQAVLSGGDSNPTNWPGGADGTPSSSPGKTPYSDAQVQEAMTAGAKSPADVATYWSKKLKR